MHKQELATIIDYLQPLLTKEDIDLYVENKRDSSSIEEYKYHATDFIATKLIEIEMPAFEGWNSLYPILPAFNSKDLFVKSMVQRHIMKYFTPLAEILYDLQSSENLSIVNLKFKQELLNAEENFHKANPEAQNEQIYYDKLCHMLEDAPKLDK
ncbi:MAG: hypothetical protein COA94_05500 [Rickettsiales bacterium]|nr:MAG: hypothetical protein COA94_05500 [Rickettsiales bacterium]